MKFNVHWTRGLFSEATPSAQNRWTFTCGWRACRTCNECWSQSLLKFTPILARSHVRWVLYAIYGYLTWFYSYCTFRWIRKEWIKKIRKRFWKRTSKRFKHTANKSSMLLGPRWIYARCKYSYNRTRKIAKWMQMIKMELPSDFCEDESFSGTRDDAYPHYNTNFRHNLRQ